MDEVENYLLRTDRLPHHSNHKFVIINRYLVSKVRWEFTIYSFSETWIKQNLDIAINQRFQVLR